MKLSEAQTRVLRAIAGGAVLFWWPGGRPCLLHESTGSNIASVHKATARFLIRHSLVTLVSLDQPCCEFDITPAGREALGNE